jgi:hypothetical protein
LFITDPAPFTAQTYAELRGRLEQSRLVHGHRPGLSAVVAEI